MNDEIRDTPAKRARASRIAQGLPPVITNKAILARIAIICRQAKNNAAAREALSDDPADHQ